MSSAGKLLKIKAEKAAVVRFVDDFVSVEKQRKLVWVEARDDLSLFELTRLYCHVDGLIKKDAVQDRSIKNFIREVF